MSLKSQVIVLNATVSKMCRLKKDYMSLNSRVIVVKCDSTMLNSKNELTTSTSTVFLTHIQSFHKQNQKNESGIDSHTYNLLACNNECASFWIMQHISQSLNGAGLFLGMPDLTLASLVPASESPYNKYAPSSLSTEYTLISICVWHLTVPFGFVIFITSKIILIMLSHWLIQ